MTEAGFEGLGEAFVGPTAVAYSKGDVVAPARVLYNFSKEHQALELLSVLQAPMRNMACVVKAVSEQKEAGVEAPVTEEAAE